MHRRESDCAQVHRHADIDGLYLLLCNYRTGSDVLLLPSTTKNVEYGGTLSPNFTMAETVTPAEQTDTPVLAPEAIRALQLEASRLQLRIANLTTDERAQYENIMNTLRANNADDWGD
jgi:hypothetical protein